MSPKKVTLLLFISLFLFTVLASCKIEDKHVNSSIPIIEQNTAEIENIETQSGIPQESHIILEDSSQQVQNTIEIKEEKADSIADTPSNSDKTIDIRTITDYQYIAITFDDGPIEGSDERLLDLFTQYNGHTTFFVNGHKIEEYDQSLKKIVDQGSEIGNHTYYHPNMRDLNEEQTLAEVEDLNDLIEQKAGVRPIFIRPPFGEFKQLTLDTLAYPLVTWSQDSRDWEIQDKDFILENILNTRPGSIILCHNTIPQTIDAVEEALPILYEQGYRFVTISDLFKIYGVEPQPHQIYWYPQVEG